ncbi:hypothetical protein CAEBREN_31059 [Caenorhabditis brenneri]|uniref:DNA/RNA-binding domain-containing protein n=1 Tax=Caenorhabditis brenneri TaxID=135651 RepID=G0PF29_CAEBE|nr:hypothetical protein CAEBREN_31059 [Caenorhabditis brenneri]
MSEEYEELLVDLKKMPRGVDSAPQYLRHLMKMFVSDFETSMSKRLDIKFWDKLKKMMDEMQKASENDRLVDLNVQNLAVGFLTDLSLLVHYHYEIPSFGDDISTQLTFTPNIFFERKQVKSKKNCKVFMAYILLRMGDLMRYKENYPKAREFYEQSCRINPADGAVWNQLGLISVLSAQNLESVYYHTRALHSTLEFPMASGGLTNIFKKYANRDISKSMPTNELYLACLAKIHFLLEIEYFEQHTLKISQKLATSKTMLIPLMSVFEHLEDGTEIEHRAIGYIKEIWSDACKILLKVIIDRLSSSNKDVTEVSNLLHILSLFYRAPQLVPRDCEAASDAKKISELLIQSISSGSSDIETDSDGLRYFNCLEEQQYPLKRSELAQLLNGDVAGGNDSDEGEEEEEDQGETSIDDSSVYTTSSSKNTSKNSSPTKSPRKVQRQLSESSDEEVLKRGRRRGRRLEESVDSEEDEDF